MFIRAAEQGPDVGLGHMIFISSSNRHVDDGHYGLEFRLGMHVVHA